MKHFNIQKLIALSGAFFTLLLAVGILLAAGLPRRADYTGQFIASVGQVAPEVGSVAPPFTLPTLDEQTLNLLDLRGNPVIINFWATWCVPCRIEMPTLQSLYNEQQAAGLEIIGVNLGETPAAVQAWVNEFDLTFPIVLDTDRSIEAQYRLRGQPSTVVVAPDGTITAIFYGPVNESELRASLAY